MSEQEPRLTRTSPKGPSKPTKDVRHRNMTWTYAPYPAEDSDTYAIWAGELVIGLIKEKGDADLICHARNEIHRMGVDVRRKNTRIRVQYEEKKLLLDTLRRILDILQKSTSPMDLTKARQEASKILKKVTVGGRD